MIVILRTNNSFLRKNLRSGVRNRLADGDDVAPARALPHTHAPARASCKRVNGNTNELSLPYVSDMSVPPMKTINRLFPSSDKRSALISSLCAVLVANRLTAAKSSHRPFPVLQHKPARAQRARDTALTS